MIDTGSIISQLYDELMEVSKRQEVRAMSNETKKKVEEAQKFFKQVEEGAKTFQGIPDKTLTEKIKKVGDGAGEIVKHITEHTEKH